MSSVVASLRSRQMTGNNSRTKPVNEPQAQRRSKCPCHSCEQTQQEPLHLHSVATQCSMARLSHQLVGSHWC